MAHLEGWGGGAAPHSYVHRWGRNEGHVPLQIFVQGEDGLLTVGSGPGAVPVSSQWRECHFEIAVLGGGPHQKTHRLPLACGSYFGNPALDCSLTQPWRHHAKLSGPMALPGAF